MIKLSFAKKLFWNFSLPSSLVLALVCLVKGINPLDTMFSLIPFLSAVPLMIHKTEEWNEGAILSQQEEFKAMGATEFLNFINVFKNIPLGAFRACVKEAYRREYLKRYGKDIFHDLPMFGE